MKKNNINNLNCFCRFCQPFICRVNIKGQVQTEANKTKYRGKLHCLYRKVSGNFKPPAKNPEMNQKNLMFTPRVLPVFGRHNR